MQIFALSIEVFNFPTDLRVREQLERAEDSRTRPSTATVLLKSSSLSQIQNELHHELISFKINTNELYELISSQKL